MKEKIRSISFAALLIGIALFNIIKSDKSFSSKENRYLQELPKINKKNIISGEFGESFEKYSTDQFIGRDMWISLKTISDLSMLKKDNNRVYFGKEDYLFDVDMPIDEEQSIENINNINLFLNTMSVNHENVNIYALLVPSKSQALYNKLPMYAPVIDEKLIADKLNSSLNSNIQIFNLMNRLSEKSNEYIYYKTDHHWTTKGAFYGYNYFLEMKGDKPLLEDDFIIINKSKDFLGTGYRKANYYLGKPDEIQIYNPKENIDYNITINQKYEGNSLYDESYLSKTDKYSYFLGGDKSLIEINTSIKNNKTILIVKDSFANSFIPFLTNHYENIIIVDPRYFKMNLMNFIEEKEIDEILFLFNIQNLLQEKSFNILSIK